MQCQKLKTYMETGRVVFLPYPGYPAQSHAAEAGVSAGSPGRAGRILIRAHWVLQPLSVRRTAGGYELIAGERRLRAAAQAGLTEVPCILLQMDDEESGIAALVENLQRQGSGLCGGGYGHCRADAGPESFPGADGKAPGKEPKQRGQQAAAPAPREEDSGCHPGGGAH